MAIVLIKIAMPFHKPKGLMPPTCLLPSWSRTINEKFTKSKVTIVIKTVAQCGRMRHYGTEYVCIGITIATKPMYSVVDFAN